MLTCLHLPFATSYSSQPYGFGRRKGRGEGRVESSAANLFFYVLAWFSYIFFKMYEAYKHVFTYCKLIDCANFLFYKFFHSCERGNCTVTDDYVVCNNVYANILCMQTKLTIKMKGRGNTGKEREKDAHIHERKRGSHISTKGSKLLGGSGHALLDSKIS